MDARTIAGAGLIIGGGLVGYKAMKDLSGLGCYTPASMLTLGLVGVGGGIWMFNNQRKKALMSKAKEVKDKVSEVMESEYFPWLPDDMPAGAIVVPNTYGDTSSAAGMPDGSGRGVPQWYGSAEHSQGYDDRDDESIGMRHRGKHKQSLKDRRDESKGMTDSLDPHHPYADVTTMSAERKYGKRDRYTDRWGNARYFTRRKDGTFVTSVNIAGKRGAVANDRRQGAKTYKPSGYRQMGDAKPVGGVERALKNMFGSEYEVVESGLPVIPDSYGTNSAMDSGYGVPVWYGSAEGKYGKRQRFDHIKGNSRYVARDTKGRFISNVSVAGKRGSIAQDKRKMAKSYKPVGYRQMGDGKRVPQSARASKNQ
tara:strand:- start:235 stop:1335 length:1101 start_codon:yes stop_codon:yes gene_type:complete